MNIAYNCSKIAPHNDVYRYVHWVLRTIGLLQKLHFGGKRDSVYFTLTWPISIIFAQHYPKLMHTFT